MGPEESKYLRWLKRQKAKGLKNVHYSYGDVDSSNVSREALFKEMNAMNQAVAVDAGEPLKFNDSRKYRVPIKY